MCGIAGIFVGPDGSREGLEEVARAMAEPLRHRGPDDSGTWVDRKGRAAFGFRRLSIFDPSPLGHQPMASPSGRFVIVFNGEIYNHPELRSELRGEGIEFRSGTDTEVLLAGFERWGIFETLGRSRGMWAMGVWDNLEGRLWLARDRLGIKPLFLYRAGGVVAFASELRSLHRVPGVSLTVDMDSVASFLEFLYVPAPHSIFEEVKKVTPGTLLRIDDVAGEPRAESFWSLTRAAEEGLGSPFTGDDAEAVHAVREKLREAVRIRLRADVPVGAFLSGGVDSSTVVALAQEAASEAVRTFTIAFDDDRFDEGPIATEVAERLGTRHTQVRLSTGDLLNLVPRMADVFDEPFADPSQLPTLLVSEVARRDVTVSLSGDGGDEVFAGYNRYLKGERLLGSLGRMSSWRRGLMAAGLKALPAALLDGPLGVTAMRMGGASDQHRPSARFEKLKAVLEEASDPDRYRALLAVNHRVPDLVTRGSSRIPGIRGAFDTEGTSILRRMMLADQDGYVEDDLLPKLDRTSMAVSLEARVPLLDHEVIELSWSLPDRVMTKDGRGKWILREILAGFVPRSLIDRPKMGFSVPVEAWLRGPLRGWVEDLMSPESVSRAGLMSPGVVYREWEALRDSGRGNPLRVWAMAMLQGWWHAWCADRSRAGSRI